MDEAPLAVLDVNQRYTLAEALRYLRISKPTLYRLFRDGHLTPISEYGRRFVSGAQIAERSKPPQP